MDAKSLCGGSFTLTSAIDTKYTKPGSTAARRSTRPPRAGTASKDLSRRRLYELGSLRRFLYACAAKPCPQTSQTLSGSILAVTLAAPRCVDVVRHHLDCQQNHLLCALNPESTRGADVATRCATRWSAQLLYGCGQHNHCHHSEAFPAPARNFWVPKVMPRRRHSSRHPSKL